MLPKFLGYLENLQTNKTRISNAIQADNPLLSVFCSCVLAPEGLAGCLILSFKIQKVQRMCPFPITCHASVTKHILE